MTRPIFRSQTEFLLRMRELSCLRPDLWHPVRGPISGPGLERKRSEFLRLERGRGRSS